MAISKAFFVIAAAATLLVGINPSHADEGLLKAGSYEVEVNLILPHLETLNTKSVVTICLSSPHQHNYGLAVLSNNNPLTKCPSKNVRRSGHTLTFEIVCQGPKAARATARYKLARQYFDGRITMKMGGKNMTMTETQRGRRIGDCNTTTPPRSQ